MLSKYIPELPQGIRCVQMKENLLWHYVSQTNKEINVATSFKIIVCPFFTIPQTLAAQYLLSTVCTSDCVFLVAKYYIYHAVYPVFVICRTLGMTWVQYSMDTNCVVVIVLEIRITVFVLEVYIICLFIIWCCLIKHRLFVCT